MPPTVHDCDCGFTDSTDPTKSIFTSFIAVNFSSTASSELSNLFIPATYEVTSSDAPYSRNFSADLVQLSDEGLHLSVLPPVLGQVPSAQIFSWVSTFAFGSYHAWFRTSEIPGTVTAFYIYRNDSSEVDVEHINGWEQPTLLYTVKPQIYLDNGNPDNSTYQREAWNDTTAAFHQEYHDWSFVWLPNIVHFGLDASYLRSITTNVPQAPGRLALNHWSDGNPKYSLGPPTQNSTATVALLWATYNDTNADALACKKTSVACTITDGVLQSSTISAGVTGKTIPSTTVVNFALANTAPGWLYVLSSLFLSYYTLFA